MFRTVATRNVPRTLQAFNSISTRNAFTQTILRSSLRTSARSTGASPMVALTLRKPAQKALVRYAHNITDATGSAKEEAKWAEEKLEPTPETVSIESSINNAADVETPGPEPEKDVDMMAGIRSDFQTIVDTFSLKNVPPQAMYMGLAGVIPYLATSLATVALSFDIQYAAHHGQGLILSGHVSEQLLHIIEPIQLGYGASIISFLGAIHWGLEWAGYGGYQGYPRYAIGVIATAVAWPTVALSAEIGLITQFLAFTFLYYTDVRAARAGWAPRWYGIYRFVLTFIVGAAIVASLIGRGQISDLISAPTGPADRMRAIRAQQLADLEEEKPDEITEDEEKEDEVEEKDKEEAEE